jgi:hypothetical protein
MSLSDAQSAGGGCKKVVSSDNISDESIAKETR